MTGSRPTCMTSLSRDPCGHLNNKGEKVYVKQKSYNTWKHVTMGGLLRQGSEVTRSKLTCKTSSSRSPCGHLSNKGLKR